MDKREEDISNTTGGQTDCEPSLLQGQIEDFMEGIGASEDHEDIIKALSSLGLERMCVKKMMRALVGLAAQPKAAQPKAAQDVPHLADADVNHIIRTTPMGVGETGYERAANLVRAAFDVGVSGMHALKEKRIPRAYIYTANAGKGHSSLTFNSPESFDKDELSEAEVVVTRLFDE